MGDVLGDGDGDIDGDGVFGVGDIVGFLVGEMVGNSDGLTVGEIRGIGDGDGDAVGLGVGNVLFRIHPYDSSHPPGSSCKFTKCHVIHVNDGSEVSGKHFNINRKLAENEAAT